MSAFKPVLQRLFHDFAPQHIYGYAFIAKSLQLHVSLRFSAPRYESYCKIWVQKKMMSTIIISNLFIVPSIFIRPASEMHVLLSRRPLVSLHGAGVRHWVSRAVVHGV